MSDRVLDAHPFTQLERTQSNCVLLLILPLSLLSSLSRRHGGLQVHALLLVLRQGGQLTPLHPAEQHLGRAEAVGAGRVPEKLDSAINVLSRVFAL